MPLKSLKHLFEIADEVIKTENTSLNLVNIQGNSIAQNTKLNVEIPIDLWHSNLQDLSGEQYISQLNSGEAFTYSFGPHEGLVFNEMRTGKVQHGLMSKIEIIPGESAERTSYEELALRQLPQFVCMINSDLNYVYLNFVPSFNGKMEDYIGSSILNFIHNKDRERLKTFYQKVLRTGEPDSTILTSISGMNNHVNYQIYAKRIDIDGAFHLLITSRMIPTKFEDHLEELPIIQSFIHEIGQKLTSPIDSIQSCAYRLYADTNDADCIEAISSIINGSNKIQRGIQNAIELLDFSSVNDEKITNFSVLELLHEIAKECRADVIENKVSLSYPGIDVQLKGSRKSWRIFLKEVILNAIQNTKLGGTVDISMSTEKDQTILNVSDNGVGMPKEVVEELEGEAGKVKIKELGLGLNLVKSAIEKLGGSIILDTHEDRGTKFSIIIPRQHIWYKD